MNCILAKVSSDILITGNRNTRESQQLTVIAWQSQTLRIRTQTHMHSVTHSEFVQPQSRRHSKSNWQMNSAHAKVAPFLINCKHNFVCMTTILYHNGISKATVFIARRWPRTCFDYELSTIGSSANRPITILASRSFEPRQSLASSRSS